MKLWHQCPKGLLAIRCVAWIAKLTSQCNSDITLNVSHSQEVENKNHRLGGWGMLNQLGADGEDSQGLIVDGQLYPTILGPAFRLTFLPVQENRTKPGYVLKNCLRAEIVFSGKCCRLVAKRLSSKSAVAKQFSTFQRDSGVNFCDRARIRVIEWVLKTQAALRLFSITRRTYRS